MSPRSESSSYLGFPLLIGDRAVVIFDPVSKREVCKVSSVKQARLFVKGWRREERAPAAAAGAFV